MTVSIVYETHSTTTDNEAGLATGWLPGVLSAAGRAEAIELGTRRRADGIATVYVSDLERALQTVRVAFGGTALPVRVDERLRECNYGLLNGAPREALDPQRLMRIDEPWPAGESYRDVVGRTAGLLADIRRQHPGERVLLVGHSANRWALENLLLGRDLAEVLSEEFVWRPGWEYVLEP